MTTMRLLAPALAALLAFPLQAQNAATAPAAPPAATEGVKATRTLSEPTANRARMDQPWS